MTALDLKIKKLIRQDMRSMHACAARDSAGMVKFDVMQSPSRLPDALKALEGLRNRKVAVKNVSKMYPLLANGLRLSVGTADAKRANAGRT